MAKKVLILNGSPRINGNTSGLTSAFKKGAEDAGHTVKEYYVANMNINGCKSCYKGTKNPYDPCVIKDDMCKIYPDYFDCDVLVFASPLYYWNISGYLKTVIDRFFGVAECYPGLKNPYKETVLLMVAEGDGFKQSVDWYRAFTSNCGWKNLGEVLCGFVEHPGDIESKANDVLLEAYNLGFNGL